MRKLIFLLIIFSVFVYSGLAQNTRSPYSIFGPGELQPKGFGKNLAMGGAGIGMKSEGFLNNLNPASYAGLDSIRFTYEIGFEGKHSNFRSQGKTLNDYTFNFKYIAIGFRVNKWWSGSMGIAPFSNVGYKIQTVNDIYGSDEQFVASNEGSGGISQVYWGNALRFGNLSLGVHSSYLFGSIIQDEIIVPASDVFTSFVMERTDYLHSMYFDYGLQYSFKLKKWDLTLGGVYSNEQRLVSKHKVDVKSSSYTTLSSEEFKSKYLKVPEKIGFGIGLKKGLLLNMGLDYELQKWSGITYPTQKGAFVDSHRFAFGAESKPWGEIVTLDWYKKLTYRFGANYKTSYLNINNTLIDEKAVTFGIGVPFKTPVSTTLMNFTVELGSKGTVQNHMIRENYVMFHMNFTLNEVWFMRKIFY